MVILNHLKSGMVLQKNFQQKFRVISVDLPGHGLSDIYGETHTMEFMADVVKELA